MVVESGNSVYDSREKCNAIIETATNTLIAGCQSTTIPNSITIIGDYAFLDCSFLASISIPNSVTSIGYAAFAYCSALTSLTIPKSVTNIREAAFYSCTSLNSVSLPTSVTSIGEAAFHECSSLISITIPKSVTTIEDYTFYNCSSLTSITIPNSVTSIKDEAFSYCSSLTSITIPNSVKSIGGRAFYGCSSITSITLPNSVIHIGYGAFAYCSALSSVTSLSCTPPSCGNDVFYHTPSEKTLVVQNIENYKNVSPWSDFTSFEGILKIKLVTLDAEYGTAQIDQDVDCDSMAIISATANYGYHFKQWSDGNADNPRTIKLTQDTTLTAEFAPNQYSLTTMANYAERGTVQGDTVADYLTEIQLSAIANYGYHFTQWGDGNTDNPRTISLTKNTNLVALFEKNQYTITTTCNAVQGTISGKQEAEYLDEVTLNVLPNVGWHFTQWTDGNTDNPRTFTLTQDTTFVAEFEMDYSGKCGDDLYWAYSNQEIKITGTGAMYNYTESTMPWTLFRDSIMTVRVDSSVTSIGEYAFANTPKLAELHIGAHVEAIGANAFLGCNRLYHIYCYPVYPPFAVESSFANYNVHLHIPCEAKEEYTLDLVWGLFKYIECLDSEMGIDDPKVPIGNFHQNKIEKLLRNGQVLIIRNGETYDMMGQRL